ncbi:transcription factor IIA, alpha/beta subunit [Piedraia hortae CBS 480.64]|uniref:Transcription factor IIA, alpha/beta subunit n=1 Tax=Piedraia hortae CBS 480.64 TaxID=1314780 RepID=A0A6A7BSF4_9PEZI|nr:transcription factor IIA, alpha/beta subunit [Piedraia hortae CBS 480.64]
MSRMLVGDVYAKIIEAVVEGSKSDFEEHGIRSSTLEDLQKGWQIRLTQRGVAHMPWDPKPAPVPVQQTPLPLSTTHGMPSYGYPPQQGGVRVKGEPGSEHGYLSNGYAADSSVLQGNEYRARQLMQDYGQTAVNAQRAGLALPGQRPQAVHQAGQQTQHAHHPHSQTAHQLHVTQQTLYAQQRRQMMMQQQQAAAQTHQAPSQAQAQSQSRVKVEHQVQPRIKLENGSSAYGQTDGAHEGLDEWRNLVAQRRAAHAANGEQADGAIRDMIMQSRSDMESGLMLPLAGASRCRLSLRGAVPQINGTTFISQLDGVPEDEQKATAGVKVSDDEDSSAINSDLDDEALDRVNEDEDDMCDTILCTYDKVQRVKNKWKCTLKDGVMNVDNREYVFHKATGEFEW